MRVAICLLFLLGSAGCSGADAPAIPDFVPDTTEPTVSITMPASSAKTSSAAPSVTGSAAPPDAGPAASSDPVPLPLPIVGHGKKKDD